MANALDTFREQRAAAGEVYAALRETSELLRGLQAQVKVVTRIDDLQTVLKQEDRWLKEAKDVVTEMRRLRDDEMRLARRALVRRWALALIFALASAAVAGAGYAWWTHPYEAEMAALRSRIEAAEYVEQRVMTMTPVERRQFDALMKWPVAKKP